LSTSDIIVQHLKQFALDDKKNIIYLIYYSIVEAILLLISPLTSAFIINSVLAHATISITVLSIVVIVIFMMIVMLQVIKSYILEKVEQSIFVKNSMRISSLATQAKGSMNQEEIDKYMNYFFDVISIQKLLPVLFMNMSGLLIKLIVALLLLLFFDVTLFAAVLVFTALFMVSVYLLGKNGPAVAIERSNAKHEAIHYLQTIPLKKENSSVVLKGLDKLLVHFIHAREKMFRIVVKQLSLAFFVEGVMLSSFFILGGYLVFEGIMPIGEFVAAEIIIIALANSLRDFVKQVDYIYDMIEGFYKVEKLSDLLKKG